MLASSDIVEEVGGTYSYYCYVLADFDPIRASELEAECSVEDITKAMMARALYHKPKKDA